MADPTPSSAARRGRRGGVVAITITMVLASVLVTLSGARTPADAATRFSDVPASHTFTSQISWLAGRGVSTGYSDGTFRPAAPVLREQMAAFLHRYAGSPAVPNLPSVSPFVDVPTSHAFYRQMVWLERTGITTGYEEPGGRRSFRPAQPVLREQMAAFLHRFNGSPRLPGAACGFTDAVVFGPQICWLRSTGITTGYVEPNGSATFRGPQPVLREQMAAFLFRYDTAISASATAQPTIVGVVAVGRTVGVEIGRWDPVPPSLGHQWLRDGLPIAGATGATYAITAQDRGHNLAVQVTGLVPGFRPVSAQSAATQVPATSRTLRVAGTLTTSTTWGGSGIDTVVVAGDVSVPARTTLTVAAGTTVRAESGRAIEVHGGLVAVGTGPAPIRFTTPADAPGEGLWRGIRVHGGAAVELAHVQVAYAQVGVEGVWPGPVASFVVRDSTFTDVRDHGIRLAASTTAPVVQRTITTRSGGSPIVLRSDQLDPALVVGNGGTEVGGPVQLAGTVSTSGTLTTGGLPFGVGHEGGRLSVAAGVTLTIPAGQVWQNVGQAIDVAGSLVVAGTVASPVVLTSSVAEAARTDGDWEGLEVHDGGSLSMTHARVEHAVFGVKADRSPQLAIADSVIADSRSGLFVYDGSRDESPWIEQRVVRTTFRDITDTAIVLNNASLVTEAITVERAAKVLYADFAGAVLAGLVTDVSGPLWVQGTGSLPDAPLVDATGLTTAPGVPMTPDHACGPVSTVAGPAPAC